MFAPVSNAEVLSDMKRFQLWVRLSATQSTHIIVFADNAIDAKLLGEVQFGKGNVLNYTEVLD
jgi:hypothetical protein